MHSMIHPIYSHSTSRHNAILQCKTNKLTCLRTSAGQCRAFPTSTERIDKICLIVSSIQSFPIPKKKTENTRGELLMLKAHFQSTAFSTIVKNARSLFFFLVSAHSDKINAHQIFNILAEKERFPKTYLSK